MKKLLFVLLLGLYTMAATSQQVAHWVKRLTYYDGLSDNKINCILKGREGFVWIGTPQGLCRYDGFRVKSFNNKIGLKISYQDNAIIGLVEDVEGKLWVQTASGYYIFNPINNEVIQDLGTWMASRGMSGVPHCVEADKKGNLWIASSSNHLYYYDFATKRCRDMGLGKRVGAQRITDMASCGADVYVVLDNGMVYRVDGKRGKIASADKYISDRVGKRKSYYRLYADRQGGLWAWGASFVGRYDGKSWRQMSGYIVSDVAENRDGHFLLATDHHGLLVVDASCNIVRHITNSPADDGSLPDNTLQCVYVDDIGVTWVGMYRMGLACFFYGQNQFSQLALGDVCSMTQTRNGDLWIGTNDAGIFRYAGGRLESISSGLISKVIVSSLTARDGSLWFGSFQGGLVRIKDGKKTTFTQQNGKIASNDIWSLAELPNGDIAMGSLGSGLLIFHQQSGRIESSAIKLPSNYIASVAVLKKKWLAIGHSLGFSLVRLSDHKIINVGMDPRKDGSQLASPYVIQVCADSRGLLWVATSSGLNVYDVQTDQLFSIDVVGLHLKAEINAVCEDKNGVMWVTSGNKLKSVSVKRSDKTWHFFCNTYSDAEGLQKRLFNKRSILCLQDGRVLVGGIDGVNVIDPNRVNKQPSNGKVIFSGIAFYNHQVGVGDTINGHVLLSEELNVVRRLTLRHDENTFSILLASTTPGLPEPPRFMYRLYGENKRWLMTSENEPSVQFSNLSPGDYVLEVKEMDTEGNAKNEIATLKITVLPPFYLSIWAWLIYVLVVVGVVCYVYWRVKQKHKDELEKLKLRKQKELEEAKLEFFTNISHELRTPLTLIISPLESMIQQVADGDMVSKLRLMLRNANRLLFLTNQILDVRRVMQGKETLHLSKGNLVICVRECCEQFSELSDKGITLVFHAGQEVIMTMYDRDKMVKIITNLLSNAYKFTPQGSRINVSVSLLNDEWIEISVADKGPGISDEDKKHVFERFYQSPGNKIGGGSGIGLSLVCDYVKIHHGKVEVIDNEGGGSVFMVTLPMLYGNKKEEPSEGEKATRYVISSTSPLRQVEPKAGKNSKEQEEGHKNTILLVDDNDDFLTFLSGELSPYYDIRTAMNGKEALDSIRISRPDLVLTDVMMPLMDGNELCRNIKADENLSDLPVVMLTARLSDENEIESRECGADDYMKKPFSLQLLRIHIDALVSKKQIDDGKMQPRISQPKITSEDEKFVDKVTKYVEQHLDDTELSVETMASDIGLSRVQLYRRLVSLTGKTPSELIRIVRLRHAERLLTESQLTISEIAYKVGFSSQRYFSRCFKELFGYMPSEYKREKGLGSK